MSETQIFEIGPATRAFISRMTGKPDVPFDPTKEIPQKMLVVDDDQADAEVLKQRLDAMGFETHTAKDGPIALDFLMQCRNADMVFVDRSLPGLAGFEVIRLMQAAFPRQRFCIYTGHVDQEVLDIARKYGCKILQKPATDAAIKEILEPKTTMPD